MPDIARRSLQATDQAPRNARLFLADALMTTGREIREVAQLLISELVTNALRHTESDVILVDALVGARVRVSVTDASPRMPHRRSRQPDEDEGRGLWLLDEFAERWGIDTVPQDGKSIWFELTPNDSTTYSSSGA